MHILSAHCFREGVLIPGPRKLPKELTLNMVNLSAQSFWEGGYWRIVYQENAENHFVRIYLYT